MGRKEERRKENKERRREEEKERKEKQAGLFYSSTSFAINIRKEKPFVVG